MTDRKRFNVYPLQGSMPPRYSAYGSPVRKSQHAYARRAHADFKVLSGTVASFDGLTMTITAPEPNNSSADDDTTAVIFTFDDDTSPPSTGSTIKIGAPMVATAANIAAQIALAFNAVTFSGNHMWRAVVLADGITVRVEQLAAGKQGNTKITLVGATFDGLLEINGVTSFADFAPYFFGGATFDAPARFGPVRAFMPSQTLPTDALYQEGAPPFVAVID